MNGTTPPNHRDPRTTPPTTQVKENTMTAILGTDANTAYRIAMDDDGNVMLSHMMSVWNTINRQSKRHGPEDLPASMRREECNVVSEEKMTPLRLCPDEIISESFRLLAMHKNPDEQGWFNMSDVARTAYGIGFAASIGKPIKNAKFSEFMRKHPDYETYIKSDQMYVRHRPKIKIDPVTVEITCPDRLGPREVSTHPSFGAAFKSIHAIPKAIITNGTIVKFIRNNDERVAIYNANDRLWVMNDGSFMKHIDPTDPVLHKYKNGHLVGETIGFVSKTDDGRFFGNIATAHHSEGDNDAKIHNQARREFDSFQAGLLELQAMPHLAHVFDEVIEDKTLLDLWLSSFKAAERM